MSKQIQAGKAVVSVEANRSKLAAGLKAAQRELKAFAAGAAAIGAGALGTAGAVLAPMAIAVKKFAEAGTQLDYMSQRTGASVEALSELAYVANASGAGIEDIESSLMSVQAGLASGSDAFGKVGLSISKLRGMKPEEQFTVIADAIAAVPDPAKRSAAAMSIFGGAGAKLLPVLNGGAEAVEQLRSKAQRLGVVMSKDQAKAAAAYSTAVDASSISVKALTNSIAVQLAPAFTTAIVVFTSTVDTVREWVAANQGMVLAIGAGATALAVFGAGLVTAAGLAYGLSVAISVVGGIAAAVGTVLSVIGTVLSGGIGVAIAAVVVGLVGLAGYFTYTSGVGGQAMDWLGSKFQMLSDIAGPVFKGIQDAMAGGKFALAAEILWNGVQLAWSKGTDELWALWDSSANSILNVYDSVLTTMLNSFDSTLNRMLGVLDSWIATFRSKWGEVSGWIADRMLEVYGQIDSTFDAEQANQFRREDTERQNQGFARGVEERAAARDALAKSNAEERAAKNLERAADREKAASDNAVARAKRISELEAALAGSVAEAAVVAAATDELDKSKFEGVADASGVRTEQGPLGTSSGFAAALMGMSSGTDVQSKMLSENEKQTELLSQQLEVAKARTKASFEGLGVEAVSRSVARSPSSNNSIDKIVAAITAQNPILVRAAVACERLEGTFS